MRLPATRSSTEVVRAFGRLDVLVNNASTFYPTPVGTITPDQFDDLVGSNLRAPLFLSQAAAPELAKREGLILNIADIHGLRPLGGHAVYCAAKAGLLMLTRSLARELGPAIRVNAIAPGPVMWPERGVDEALRERIVARTALKRAGTADDVAKAALYFATGRAFRHRPGAGRGRRPAGRRRARASRLTPPRLRARPASAGARCRSKRRHRLSMRSPTTGCTSAGASSASGPSTQARVRRSGCGSVLPATRPTRSPCSRRSRSSVRGPHFGAPGSRPQARSMAFSRSSSVFRRQVRREADDEVDEVVAGEADRRVRVGARHAQARELAAEQAERAR